MQHQTKSVRASFEAMMIIYQGPAIGARHRSANPWLPRPPSRLLPFDAPRFAEDD